jgi:hypothetical protein
VFLLEGFQERSSSLTEVRPFSKHLNCSKACVWPRVLSPNVSLTLQAPN